jgi:hypothetical protein
MRKVFKKPGDQLRERKARIWFKENYEALKKHPKLLEAMSLIEPLMEPRFKETSREVAAAREVMAGVVQALILEEQIKTKTKYSEDAYSRNPLAALIDFPGFIGNPREKLSKEEIAELKKKLPNLIEWVHGKAKAYHAAFFNQKPLPFPEPKLGTRLHGGKAFSMKELKTAAAKKAEERRNERRKHKTV